MYVVKSGKFLKIGRTSNLTRRLSDLNHYNPVEVLLIYHFKYIGDKEHELHELCSEFHVKGEWFLRKESMPTIQKWIKDNKLNV